MGRELLDDHDWLRARYVDEGLSLLRVGALAGTATSTVRRALSRAGIATRPGGGRSRELPGLLGDRDWLLARYVGDGLTQERVAALAGTDQSRVSRALARHGIATRPAAPPRGMRSSLLADRDWLAGQKERGASNDRVAELAGCSALTVRRALRLHGLSGRAGA